MNSYTENPFRPPEARLDEPDATHGEPLYRLSAIGLGTFIGTPLAGAFLAAVNLRRLGRAQEVGKTWLVGFRRQVRLVQQVLVEFEAPGVQTVDLEHVGGFQFIEQVALCSHGQSSRIKNP